MSRQNSNRSPNFDVSQIKGPIHWKKEMKHPAPTDPGSLRDAERLILEVGKALAPGQHLRVVCVFFCMIHFIYAHICFWQRWCTYRG